METNRYFTSNRISDRRNTDVPLDNFKEMKEFAYKAASEGIKSGFSSSWADQYVNNILPSSKFMWYEDLIRAYADYLLGKKTKEESMRFVGEIETKWVELDNVIQGVFKFKKAVDEAFEKDGKEFGVVEFVCPLCGGIAVASRHHTPDNPAHSVTVREACDSCGYRSMN